MDSTIYYPLKDLAVNTDESWINSEKGLQRFREEQKQRGCCYQIKKMTLRGCFGCLKFLVFVANFLFWCLGLGVMAVSLWLLFDAKLYLQSLGSHRVDYFIGTYIILGVGAVITLVGFLGCCGAWKESPWMLGTFFVFLVFYFGC
ncbi:CD9 [Lepeophtheirus salmonis]|uniref:CD9 n=1 Tax=Lepeophtheirus salmonis TaxID=72036 RepID=A0A7R8D084_LEPSM|nr:CD9 [Lepeophtheirus salmonis]CAF2981690.1 CD9 [Lepeophtheirus salmonis]